MDWRHRAACRDEDPELFFPIGSTGPALLQVDEAKAVCRRCVVVDDCLSWSLGTSQEAGVWGGAAGGRRPAALPSGGGGGGGGGEDYGRPPLLGHEPPSRRAAAWRFRIVLLLALLALIAGIVFAIRAIVGTSNEGNPG